MPESKIDRFIRRMPKVFKAGLNPVITALLKSWASSDDEIVQQLQNTKSQLFVRTADGQYLDRLASGVGVSRPTAMGLLDDRFQELIPNLSLKAKQIRTTMYDVLDIFWGPLFTRTNTQTVNFAPFNVSTGDEFTVIVDGGSEATTKALAGDIATGGAATALEIVAILNRIDNLTASIITDPVTGDEFVNIRTDTPGNRGSLEVVASSMVGTTKLDFTTDKRFRITDLSQRAALYEIRHRELIIELPAVVPIILDTLKGSHHFHTAATIEAPAPPSNGVFQGSFLYSPTGVPYSVTGNGAITEELVQKSEVKTKITVDDASNIPNSPGFLIFDWGRNTEEQPVRYFSRPNDKTLLLDPAYVFNKTHLVGSKINVLEPELQALRPRVTGEDLAVYLVSPVSARLIVQEILRPLVAAGVVVTFIILLPEYKYGCTNPYA